MQEHMWHTPSDMLPLLDARDIELHGVAVCARWDMREDE